MCAGVHTYMAGGGVLSYCTLKCKITISEIENGWLSGCSGGRAGGDTTPSHRRPSEAGSSCEMPPPPPEQEEHSLAKSHKERLQSHTTPRPESTEPTQHQDDRKQEHVAVDTDSAFDDDASLISGSSGSSEESKRTKVGTDFLYLRGGEKGGY